MTGEPSLPGEGGAATLARGAVSGLAATVVMTGALLTARRLGLVDTPAPEAVVTGALEQADLNEEIRPPARTAVVTVAHLGYGATVGAVFAAITRPLGESPLMRGTTYGLAVWVLGYIGWLPAFRILPRPTRQGAGRHVENIVGHLVYGATLGWLTGRLRRR